MPVRTLPTLTDGVVTLRAHRPDDVAGSSSSARTPQSQQWTTVPVPYSTRRRPQRFVGELMPRGWADGSRVGLRRRGRRAGTPARSRCATRASGRAEIAYGSHPWVRGTGRDGARRCGCCWSGASPSRACTRSSGGPRRATGPRAGWPGGSGSPSRARSAQLAAAARRARDAWVGTLLRDDPREPRSTWLDATRCSRPTASGCGRWRDADVPRIVEASATRDTQHWLGRLPAPYTARPRPRPASSTGTERLATGRSDDLGRGRRRDDDRLLGSVALFDLEPELEAEVGYWTHPDARGRGLTATAAARWPSGTRSSELGLRRLTAYAAVGERGVAARARGERLPLHRRRAARRVRPRPARGRPRALRPAGYDAPEELAASRRVKRRPTHSSTARPATDSAAPTSAGAR